MHLRPLDEDNLGHYFSWRNDPRIYKWCRQNEPISWEHHLAWFEKQGKDPTVKMYEIFHKTDSFDGLSGVCGLTSVDFVNRSAEFSLYVCPNLWGQGYGRQALMLLCKKGFNTFGLNHIFGESFEGNPAIKMFESLGFKKEGTRRQFYFRDGKYIDAHIYSLLRSQCNFLQD